MKQKILASFWLPPEIVAEAGGEFELVYPQEKITGVFSLDETKKLLPDVDAAIIQGEPFTKEVIELGLKGRLKVIGRLGVGCDAVDCDFAGKSGVAVINTPHTVTEPTAELTISIMMAAARNIVHLDRQTRSLGKCGKQYSYDGLSVGLFGKTLGIIGFGRIGKAVARKARGLGMNILYSDVVAAPADVEKALDAKKTSVEDLLKQADFVSVHCPYTPENHHLINAKTLGMMKKSAVFVNASRGKMVDEAALVAALENGTIKAAALDVFEFEPEVNQKLLPMENVVIVPHIGTATYDARIEMAREVFKGTIEYLRGGNPGNIFNKDTLVKKA